MTIHLIRHTEPDIDKNICYGVTDVDLKEDYLSEAERIKSYLSHLTSHYVITSPLKRTMKLAQFISDIDPVIDGRIKELDFGDWEMKSWDSISKKEIDLWAHDVVDRTCPNGESYRDLFNRSLSFWNDHVFNKNLENLVVVTHSGVIRALLSALLEIPLEKSFLLKIDYGSVSRVKLNKEIIEIECINLKP